MFISISYLCFILIEKGNYNDFLIAKNDNDLHMIRQQHTLEKHRDSMIKTIDKLKKKSTGTSQKGNKKISKAVSSRKKKLERHGIEKDEHGHRSTVQKAGTGIRAGSINNLDASTRKKQSYRELLKRNDINVAPVPDKAVQFIFGDTNCTWGEPLISALDIGHGFGITNKIGTSTASKEKGMLFDSIDLCVGEGSTICILGENSSGKTTLLKLLAKDKGMQPLEGEVHYAHNANVSYFDQHKADELIVDGIDKYGSCTSSVALLCQMFPKKNEQDIRSELNNFGLGSQQVSTHIQFLSGGERCRLYLAMMMLEEPHVLLLDEISNHLDPESVEALGYGLKKWNGTIVLVSHDVHLIRLLEGICYVLVGNEGKLRRLEGGIDSYLKIMATTTE
jgi:ATP-binding cassette subfamily F protein 3